MLKVGDWVINLAKDSKPRELMIEVTTRCNFNCIHCFRNMMNEEFRDMDERLFKKTIDEAYEEGVEWIVFSGWGEPLIHPRIIDFIKYVKNYNFNILLNTNGYLLLKYVEELYRESIDKIVISLDSIRDDVYRRIRVGGDLNRIREALSKLKDLKIKDSSRIPEVNIHFTLNRLNVSDLPGLAEFAYRYGVSKVVLSNMIPLDPRQEDKLSCYNWSECEKVIREASQIFIKYGLEHGIEFSLPNFSISYSERACPFISRNALFIRNDGKVSPCIYYAHSWRNVFLGVKREIHEVVFGDLNKEFLIDVWHKDEFVKFRASVYFMIHPSCLDCVLVNYCTLTLSNDMDCWGNTPSCAHCPYSRDIVRCPL